MDYLLLGDNDNRDTLHDPQLLKRLRELEHFQSEDKEAVIKILDGIIVKNRTQRVMTLDEGI